MLHRLVIFILLATTNLAMAAATDDATAPILSPDIRTQGKPYPEYSVPIAEQMENASNPTKPLWPWSLPFLAQRVIDKGFKLPRPYGINLIYYHQIQAIDVSDLQVGFTDSSPYNDINFIDFGGAQIQNTTWQAKIDAWVLPFLDVFAIVGTVQGDGQVPISIANKDLYDFFIPGLCSGGSPPNFCNGYITGTAPAHYTGNNAGVGILLASGYKNFFFAMPISYVITDVNVSTTNITALNMTPRIGYNYSTTFSGKFGFYVGANYLDSRGTLTGSYILPMTGTQIGHDVTVRYQLREKPVDKWNTIFGMNWELSDLWSVVLEIGDSKNRTSETVNFGYRF